MSIKVSRHVFLAFAHPCTSACVLNRSMALVSASENPLADDGLILAVVKVDGVEPDSSRFRQQSLCSHLLPQANSKKKTTSFCRTASEEIFEVV